MNDSRIAPEGFLWVCHACGKTSRDRYGGPDAMPWWDSSCAINSGLHRESALVRGPDGRVREIHEEAGHAD